MGSDPYLSESSIDPLPWEQNCSRLSNVLVEIDYYQMSNRFNGTDEGHRVRTMQVPLWLQKKGSGDQRAQWRNISTGIV